MGASTSTCLSGNCNCTHSCEYDKQADNDTIDIQAANQAYLAQFNFSENKDEDGYNFYAINSSIVRENDCKDDIKQQHNGCEFEPEQSSKSIQQQKIKGNVCSHPLNAIHCSN